MLIMQLNLLEILYILQFNTKMTIIMTHIPNIVIITIKVRKKLAVNTATDPRHKTSEKAMP